MSRFIFCLVIFVLVFAQNARAQEDVFQRVTDKGVLRCGYYVWPPYLIVDPNTGAKSGLYYDLMNEMGKILDLKIEWTEEISWSNMFEGFHTNRIDSYCTPIFTLPSYAKATDFTQNVGFEPIHIFVRQDDTRFDGDISKINDPSVLISAMDGEVSQKVADQMFPKAGRTSVPSNSDTTLLAMNVVTKKADILITNLMLGRKFMKANPGKLKFLTAEPIQKFSFAFPVPLGNYRLKRMLDIALQSLHDNGFVDALADKYYESRDEFIRVQSGAQ